MLLGTFKEARRGSARYLRALSDGKNVDFELVDTRTEEGLIVIDDRGQRGAHADERCFQMHAIFQTIPTDENRYFPILPRIYESVAAQELWGPLSLLGLFATSSSVCRIVGEASIIATLSNVVRWWDIYWAEGPRFAGGGDVGDLWSVPSSLSVILRGYGLSTREVMDPLPEGGLRALLARHPDKFGGVLQAAGAA
jgi:hypothetical protein